MISLEKLRTFFQKDRYAMNAGAEIIRVENGNATCAFTITEDHRNAGGAVQGGAIFTLADFAFAVAANSMGRMTVSVDNHISFLKAAKGTRLIAEAVLLSSTRRMCFYEVKVRDDLGTLVANLSITGYIKEIELNFEE